MHQATYLKKDQEETEEISHDYGLSTKYDLPLNGKNLYGFIRRKSKEELEKIS